MLYFIPAWYKQNMWCENEQQWYMRRLKSEFDETIKQITLFHRNVDRPYRILVLGYSPNFRHFLHRQGMYRSKYWSCFDAIAQVSPSFCFIPPERASASRSLNCRRFTFSNKSKR